MKGLFHILERHYAQKNAHFWEEKFLLLLLLIKKYVQVPRTYQKVVFFIQKSLPEIKYSNKNLHKLGGLKHAPNFLRSIRS